MKKKGQLAANTIFYILMVLFMIGIIVFGLQKLAFTKEILSEQERLNLQQELKQTLEYCEEPLNAGNIKHFEIKNDMFNSICFLGDDFNSWEFKNYEGFADIYDSGENVVLLKSTFVEGATTKDRIHEYRVMDSFKADVQIYESFCKFDFENRGIIDIDIKCE